MTLPIFARFTMGAHAGAASWALCGGAAFPALLVWHKKRRPAPLLPLDLSRIPIVAWSAVTSVCAYAAQILAYIALLFLLQTVLHRSAVETRLLVTPRPLPVAIAAPITGRWSAHYPASVLGSIGLAVLTLGLLLPATLPASPTEWQIAVRMALCGAGFGFFQTPNNTTPMTASPAARSRGAGRLASRGKRPTVLSMETPPPCATAAHPPTLPRGAPRRRA